MGLDRSKFSCRASASRWRPGAEGVRGHALRHGVCRRQTPSHALALFPPLQRVKACARTARLTATHSCIVSWEVHQALPMRWLPHPGSIPSVPISYPRRPGITGLPRLPPRSASSAVQVLTRPNLNTVQRRLCRPSHTLADRLWSPRLKRNLGSKPQLAVTTWRYAVHASIPNLLAVIRRAAAYKRGICYWRARP